MYPRLFSPAHVQAMTAPGESERAPSCRSARVCVGVTRGGRAGGGQKREKRVLLFGDLIHSSFPFNVSGRSRNRDRIDRGALARLRARANRAKTRSPLIDVSTTSARYEYYSTRIAKKRGDQSSNVLALLSRKALRNSENANRPMCFNLDIDRRARLVR